MKAARYYTTGFLALDPRAFGQEFAVQDRKADPFTMIGNVAVIDIRGPLEQHACWAFRDYDSILAEAQLAFESQARAVALKISSPGGSAAGCFELSRALRALADESRKPLGVFVDGMAASAAYALACSATAGICAPPTSTVASLAVYEMLVEQTAADAAMGIRFNIIPSTGADLKLTGNAHVVASDEQKAHTQAQVDLLTDYFYGLVEELRGVPQSTIRALRGATLLASQGVETGLVDVLCDWDTFLANLATSKGNAMAVAKKAEGEKEKTPWKEALAKALESAESDEDAKKMLAKILSEDAPPGEDTEKKEKPAEGSATSDTTEPTEEEKKKAAAAEEEKKATATALARGGSSNEIALANRVLALEAERASEKEATARAELLAKRPDFSAEVRAAYAKLPIDALRIVVDTSPRVQASPGGVRQQSAAAAAMTPGTQAGVADAASHLSPEEQRILSRFDGPTQVAQARMEGANLMLDHMSPDAARERMKQLVAQGVRSPGASMDQVRTMATRAKEIVK